LAIEIERAEVISTESSASVIAYGADGEVIATIEAWEDDDGTIVYFADYADGFAQYTLHVDEQSFDVESDLEPSVLSSRVSAMTKHLTPAGYTPGPQEGVLACGVSILATAAATAAGNPIGATLGGIATVCNCTKLVLTKAKCPELW
jgi:hypothetical protein